MDPGVLFGSREATEARVTLKKTPPKAEINLTTHAARPRRATWTRACFSAREASEARV